jgi:hypothetical protein
MEESVASSTENCAWPPVSSDDAEEYVEAVESMTDAEIKVGKWFDGGARESDPSELEEDSAEEETARLRFLILLERFFLEGRAVTRGRDLGNLLR